MQARLTPAVSLILLATSLPAAAQNAADRADSIRAEERSGDKNEVPDSAAELPPQVVTPATGTATLGFTVGAVDITGLQAMSRTQFADIVQEYVGRELTRSQLNELTDRLAARARQTYPLAAAAIEPQTLRAGVLRVRIDEGIIDEIRIEGASNDAVLAALRPLAAGRPVTAAQLERRLLIAGDIDGASLGRPRIVQEQGRNVLVVKLAYRRSRGEMTLDNDSTKPVGPIELIADLRFNGVVADDDSFNLLALAAVPQLSEISYVRARYTKRLTPDGTELMLTGSYSSSEPGAYLKALDIESSSWLASAALQHPLWRSRLTSLWIEGSLSHRQLQRERSDVVTRHDKLTVLRASVFGFTSLAGGRLSANAALGRGMDILGANRAGDPLASRDDANGTFTTVTVSADWTRKIAGGLSVKFGMRMQDASQPLLLSEEIGIGGATFGRGYDYGEFSGDQGIMGYGELRYKWDSSVGPFNGLELYAFADAGEVDNLASGFGGGSLYSSGGGFRADVDKRTDAALEVALPLSGPRYDSGNRSPRVRFSLTRYF